MNAAMVDSIVRAVLYEGYILYPYRRGTKNQHRWTFGGLFPRAYREAIGHLEPCMAQTQCLLRGNDRTKLSVNVRFLQLIERTVRTPAGTQLDQIEVNGKRYQSWQEATERSVSLELVLRERKREAHFELPASEATEPLLDENQHHAANLVRTQRAIAGTANVNVEDLQEEVFKLTVRVQNQTPLDDPKSLGREQALLHSMASTHIVMSVTDGEFVSQIDPPEALKHLSAQCKNIGVWPVLVGEPGETDCLLASPIILYDYPQVAPESPGDLFDGTEIDEILSLRIMTLTDEEKRDVADLDERGAAMLQRTERLAREQLMRLHGTMRPPRSVQAVHVRNAELRVGDRVLLNPRGQADAFDLILRGKTATITAIEQDYENRIHLAVTVDDDPGADIGAAGQIGHRFYFGLNDVEPLVSQEAHA